MTPNLPNFEMKLLSGNCRRMLEPGLSKDFFTTPHNQKPKYAFEQKKTSVTGKTHKEKQNCPYSFPSIYIYICASHNGPSLFQGSVHRSGWTPSTTGRSSVFELEWNLLGEMNFHLYDHGILVIPWYPICNVTARPYGSPGRLEQCSNIVLQHAKKPVQGQRFGISQTTNPKP